MRLAESAEEERLKREGAESLQSKEEKRRRRAADRQAELTVDKIPDEHWDSDADENIEVGLLFSLFLALVSCLSVFP